MTAAEHQKLSPQQAVLRMITGGDARLKALWAFLGLGISGLLEDRGPMSSDDIAAAREADPELMRRFLYAIRAYGLLTTDPHGRYQLTETGRTLLPEEEGSLWAAVGVTMSPLWQKAGELLPDTIRTGRPAVLQGEDTPYPLLAREPEVAQLFDMFMNGRALLVGRALAQRDYSRVRVVADLAGGTGGMLATILEANPHLSGILLERPDVADRARAHFAERGLADRIEVIAGDIFDDECPSADVIILSSVVHNHATADNHALLTRIRDALLKRGDDARLWCVEALLPEPGVYGTAIDLDIRMMTLFHSGQERTLPQYEVLMEAAGLGLIATAPLPNDQTLMIAQPCAV